VTVHVVSASYGNDSMALIQWAHEAGLSLVGDVVVAYCDTGWQAPDWPARVAEGEAFAQRLGFRTVHLYSEGMAELVRRKKGWPGNGQQFCTLWLKGLPFLQWLDEADPDRTAIVLVGKRRAESAARAQTPEFVERSEYHGERLLWHPLYAHTHEDRNALLARAGFEPLPHRSMECSPCVNANRGDINRLTGDEIKRVSDLEAEIGKPMFRPKRFGALGVHGVVMWAKHGRHHSAVPEEPSGCDAAFGCGL
jgi:3'-phosphoadenosine 5'-phosphosulfate sulfotransferase (PAPS reductase)/FAD synthetase